jgi:hypothetical protein
MVCAGTEVSRVGARLRIVPSEAETIRTIYRLFADGLSVGEIVRRRNEHPATSNAPLSQEALALMAYPKIVLDSGSVIQLKLTP